MVRLVEHGFALSEASNMPAILELRIRACHVRGSFEARDNVAPRHLHPRADDEPAGFDYMRLAHPPVTFRHEKLKVEQRIPAARRYIAEHGLNELFARRPCDLGIIVQGGLYNALIRALQQLGLADAFGESASRCWCSTSPTRWCPSRWRLLRRQARGAGGGRRPARVHRAGPRHLLRRRDIQTPLHGKDLLPAAGEYTRGGAGAGLVPPSSPSHLAGASTPRGARLAGRQPRAALRAWPALDRPCPRGRRASASAAPSGRCSRAEAGAAGVGPVHIAADIGCHAFAPSSPSPWATRSWATA
jgi:indolepyruvate ferredoxin oxidoreductase alpha subunit